MGNKPIFTKHFNHGFSISAHKITQIGVDNENKITIKTYVYYIFSFSSQFNFSKQCLLQNLCYLGMLTFHEKVEIFHL